MTENTNFSMHSLEFAAVSISKEREIKSQIITKNQAFKHHFHTSMPTEHTNVSGIRIETLAMQKDSLITTLLLVHELRHSILKTTIDLIYRFPNSFGSKSPKPPGQCVNIIIMLWLFWQQKHSHALQIA